MRDFDVDLLYAALDHKRESQGLTWAGVAKEIEHFHAKVHVSTIKGIRGKQAIEGDGGLQMLLWLGRAPESFMPQSEVGRQHQLMQPNGAVLRFDTQEVFRRLDVKRRQEGLTWDDVAEQIGTLSASTLRRYARGGRTSFPGIMRIARWLDVPAASLTKASPA